MTPRQVEESGPRLRAVSVVLWAVAAGLVVWLGYRYVLTPPPEPGRQTFPTLQSTAVIQMPGGHAYRFVAAPTT